MKKVYYWSANSVAVPFFSEPSSGFVEAESAIKALRKKVEDYGKENLYAMVVKSCEEKSKLLARYLSAKAVATEKATELTEGGILKESGKIRVLVNGKHKFLDVSKFKEKWENFE